MPGDCFAAALCHYLAQGLATEQAMRRAVVAAALAATAVGAQGRLPDPAEIEEILGRSE